MAKQASFALRLQTLMAQGNLSVADLAHWLNRPHSTVRLWAYGKVLPNGSPLMGTTLLRLDLLERYLRAGHSIPETSAHQRPATIRQARDDFTRGIRVPTRDTA